MSSPDDAWSDGKGTTLAAWIFAAHPAQLLEHKALLSRVLPICLRSIGWIYRALRNGARSVSGRTNARRTVFSVFAHRFRIPESGGG